MYKYQNCFVIKYLIIGDAGNYEPWDGICATLEEDDPNWFSANDLEIPTGGFYPMESRRFCVRIENKGEVAIPFFINAEVTNDNENHDCANAFDLPYTFSGMASPEGYTYRGQVITIASDATPVEGCNVRVSVGRGHTD